MFPNAEFAAKSAQITRDALTLVKYKDEGVLPLSPDKTRRVMIVCIKGADTAMSVIMTKVMAAMGNVRKNPAERLQKKLIEKGFDAFIYESPIEKVRREVEEGKPFNMNLYFAGKNAIEDFKAGQDLIISLYDVAGGRPAFGMSKGGGEIPWYVFEQDVVGISVNMPTMLADVPMLRTYINCYDSTEDTLTALVDALVTGPEAFKGTDPIDSFCGLWGTRL